MAAKKSAQPDAVTLPLPIQFLAAWIGCWVARHQEETITYLKAENQALRARLGKRGLRLSVAERRKLAILGSKLGRKLLSEIAHIATTQTTRTTSTATRTRRSGTSASTAETIWVGG